MIPISQGDRTSLQRFAEAQDRDGKYDDAVHELRSGRKTTHWMWFVFPQIQGLGSSAMARRYAIHDLDEARAYLNHPVLGPRLVECTRLVNRIESRSLNHIFGDPDDMKFCSSMTLFELVAGADSEFSAALDKYCSGNRDPATLRLASGKGSS